MDQLNSAALFVALVGGAHDAFTKRIPNWLTFPTIAVGFGVQIWLFGWSGLLDAALGVAIGMGLFFPIYLLGYMGAGDVKLLMAVGSLVGGQMVFPIAVGSVILGAIYALLEILYRGRFIIVVKNTYSFLRALLVPGLVFEPLRLDRDRKFAFGLCIAGSVAVVTALSFKGYL